jgi:hypothetical protein
MRFSWPVAIVTILALLAEAPGALAARHKRTSHETSAWALNFDRSGLDDSPQVYATNRPVPFAAGMGDLNAVKEAVAYCRDHTIGFAVKSEGSWGYSWTGPFYLVAASVDEGAPLTQSWKAADDGVATEPFAPGTFLQGLPNDGLLRLSVLDVYGGDHQAIFRLRGLARVRAAIARACGAS